MAIVKYILHGVLIVLDKLANVLLGGSPHRTISMRVAFAVYCDVVTPRYFWVVPLSKFIDWLFDNKLYTLEKNHIYNSYECDEILSKALWRWFTVENHQGYNLMVREVEIMRTRGRKSWR